MAKRAKRHQAVSRYYNADVIKTPMDDEASSVDDLVKRYSANQWDAWKSQDVVVEVPTVSQAAPYVFDLPDRDTFLWRYLDRALKEHHNDAKHEWVPQYQKRGTCVGQGFKLCTDIVMAINYLLGHNEFSGRAAVASIYAGSRVDVGGRPGRWDGSNGSWASKWLVNFGVVLLSELDLPDDARDADERIATSWTSSRQGVPVKFEDLAKDRPITRRLLVTKAREAGKLIQSGTPIADCSNLIPTGRRDANGFSPARRSGGHCTAFTAVRYEPFGLLYQNSWSGSWGSGGTYPDDQPPGSVWVSERDANAILSQGDSYGLIGISGLEQLPSELAA